MDAIAQLGSIMGLSFISGINLYATIAVVGICGRFHLVQALPAGLDPLMSWPVIIVAVLLYVVEFLADKVPGFDSLWDTLHTFIRPLGGAVLALMQVGEVAPALEVIVFMLGASLATASHLTKASARLIVNTSPEPVSNTIVSLGEDAGAIGFSYMSIAYPRTTFFVTIALALIIAYFLPMIFRIMGMVLSSFFVWLKSLFQKDPGTPGPAPLPPRFDDFLDSRKKGREKIVWTGKGFARKIPDVPKFAALRVAVSGKTVYFLYKRWFKMRAQELPLKDVKKAQIYPRLLTARWLLRTHEKDWLVSLYKSLSKTLPQSISKKE
ncbi:MAG: DUF4126 domain-containing protein [Deltaproteobacteria bacterium]|nr:DUF4126 domain-containing protein [Deltaproteobacteria bacterium]